MSDSGLGFHVAVTVAARNDEADPKEKRNHEKERCIASCAASPPADVTRIESVLCVGFAAGRSCCRSEELTRFICAPINGQSGPVGAHPSERKGHCSNAGGLSSEILWF